MFWVISLLPKHSAYIQSGELLHGLGLEIEFGFFEVRNEHTINNDYTNYIIHSKNLLNLF